MAEPIEDPSALGALARRVRKSEGLRQDELALAAGVSVSFLVDMEGGKPTCEVGKVLRTLAALGAHVSVDHPALAGDHG